MCFERARVEGPLRNSYDQWMSELAYLVARVFEGATLTVFAVRMKAHTETRMA